MSIIKVGNIEIGDKRPLVFIGGPCAIENKDHALYMADALKTITDKLDIPFIYKSCYDKDCRSSTNSFLGVGLEEGLEILEEVKEKIGVPVTSDVSNAEWMRATGEVVDLIQIPAYLCRQTHLLIAAGETGKPINIKKGQFMSPWNLRNSVKKIITRTGNDQIMLTDRGTFFGYEMLVNDFRFVKIFKEIGCPVCYDATHSIQLPTHEGTISKGEKQYIPSLVRAAAGAGINALFMEVHDNPPKALSDPATQVNLKFVEQILIQAKTLHDITQTFLSNWSEDSAKETD